jgi:hypothetical protein
LSPEQKKVVHKCRDMLKRAFPDLTGYVKFDMGKTVKAVVCTVNLKVEE